MVRTGRRRLAPGARRRRPAARSGRRRPVLECMPLDDLAWIHRSSWMPRRRGASQSRSAAHPCGDPPGSRPIGSGEGPRRRGAARIGGFRLRERRRDASDGAGSPWLALVREPDQLGVERKDPLRAERHPGSAAPTAGSAWKRNSFASQLLARRLVTRRRRQPPRGCRVSRAFRTMARSSRLSELGPLSSARAAYPAFPAPTHHHLYV